MQMSECRGICVNAPALAGSNEEQRSAGKRASGLVGFACSRSRLFCDPPVFFTPLRAPCSQLIVKAGDFVLLGSKGFYRRQPFLAQSPSPRDCLAGVRQRRRVFTLAVLHQPAEFCLLPLPMSLRPAYRCFMAVETLPTESQQLT